MQGKLGAASQRLPMRSGHYWLVVEAQAHHQLLEGLHRLLKLLPLSLCGCHSDHEEVSSHTEVADLVADHQPNPAVAFQFTERLHAHFYDVRIDGVGLRVNLKAEHAISKIKQTGRIIASDFFACLTQRVEGDALRIHSHRLVGPRGRVIDQFLAIPPTINRGATIKRRVPFVEHLMYPGGQCETELLH